MSDITIKNTITDPKEREQRFAKLNRIFDNIPIGKDSRFLKQVIGFTLRSQKRAGITQDYIDENFTED